MRKLLLILALLALPFGVKAQESPMSGVVWGSALVNDDFDGDTWAGGLNVGAAFRLDDDKSLRLTYKRAAFGPASEDFEALSAALLMDWWDGEKWGFYVVFGMESYVDGEFNGTDGFLGFGLDHKVFRANQPNYKVPFGIDMFTEFIVQDADAQVTGGFFQINFGLKFSRPVK